MTPILYNQTSTSQLEDNSLIVIPQSKEAITFECPNQNIIEIISQPSLIQPYSCKIIIKDQYYTQKPDIITPRLKLPSIIINEKLILNIEPLQLKEINLEKIQEELQHVNSLTIHPLKPYNNETLNLSFQKKRYTVFFRMYTNFQRTYLGKDRSESLLGFNKFLIKPILVIVQNKMRRYAAVLFI
ncbi:hypothetical protein ABEB36_004604 [Hypothenemus hampei]|uniref:Double jelly roll-like domain-containing protein n=1 Tax=Hypothenemus hampei TaxID=57062 RepID=A0ABD1F3V1_HYPHA